MISTFKQVRPMYGGFDTETTGLNIALDKPFLYQFGFVDGSSTGYTYVVDIENDHDIAIQTIRAWHQLCKHLTYLVGHNPKFDLHMMANLGEPYPHDNVTDTEIYIRLGSNAVQQANGGVPMGLKEYASKFIDPNAKVYEKQVKSERMAIAKEYTQRLKTVLACCKPSHLGKWTLANLEEFFKDVIVTADDLPEDAKVAYNNWYKSLPFGIRRNMKSAIVGGSDIPYNLVDRQDLIRYGHYDIIFTLEIFMQIKDIIKVRHQEQALEIEEKVLLPFWRMERNGFEMNKPYIYETKEKMVAYIKRRRKDLESIVGYPIKVNQHAVIKRLLKEKYDLEVEGTGSDVLDTLMSKIDNEECKTFVSTIQELRTLEKWYQTYLMRFVREAEVSDRIYTQINQCGCVSGRVSSDFQQFPKYPFTDIDGNELFSPRRMINITGFYLDYSQVELRLTAFYTILVGNPDKNLCRAYMPYKCYRILEDETKEMFDYTNPKHIKEWDDPRWCHEEDGTPWTKLDLHGAMTKTATGLTEDDPEFKHARSAIGKRVNFAWQF